MAPFESQLPLVLIAIGFGFGFSLERAGFGDCRRLAAQFYLYEMRVLKVMFTAIVVAMSLVFWSSAMGWLDFERVAVNETYLPSAALGGLLLGAGFILGGYCPGTSIVSAVTGKLDGLMFLVGVTLGVFAFGETADLYGTWYETAGYRGRQTLMDLSGLPTGVVVLGVVLAALGAFRGASLLERRFAGLNPEAGACPAAPPPAELAAATPGDALEAAR